MPLIPAGDGSINQNFQMSRYNPVLTDKYNGEIATSSTELNSRNDSDNVLFQSAYHGSPYRFDKFTTDKIGTGEGVQARGWGLYFALDKQTSESYRAKLSNIQPADKLEQLIKKYDGTDLFDYLNLKWFLQRISQFRNNYQDLITQEIDKYESAIEELKEFNIDTPDVSIAALKFLKEVSKLKLEDILSNDGTLYKVDITEDNEMLWEDKTFKEQPEGVRRRLEQIYKNYFSFDLYNEFPDNPKGEEIYYSIASAIADDESLGWYYLSEYQKAEFYKKASKLLNEYGIKGIRYNGVLDSECAVVFDDRSIRILEFLQAQNMINKLIMLGGRKLFYIFVYGNYIIIVVLEIVQ